MLAIIVRRAIALYSIMAFSHCLIYLRRLGRRAGRGRAVGRGRGRGVGRVGRVGRLGGLFGVEGLLGSKIGPTPGRLVTGRFGRMRRPPVSDGLGGRGIRRGGRLPPLPTSCGLGGRGILVRRLAIGFLLISFQRTSLPLVFQSLQQQ